MNSHCCHFANYINSLALLPVGRKGYNRNLAPVMASLSCWYPLLSQGKPSRLTCSRTCDTSIKLFELSVI